MRDKIVEKRLMSRIVADLKYLMDIDDSDLTSDVELLLWSELETIAAGVNWAEDS